MIRREDSMRPTRMLRSRCSRATARCLGNSVLQLPWSAFDRRTRSSRRLCRLRLQEEETRYSRCMPFRRACNTARRSSMAKRCKVLSLKGHSNSRPTKRIQQAACTAWLRRRLRHPHYHLMSRLRSTGNDQAQRVRHYHPNLASHNQRRNTTSQARSAHLAHLPPTLRVNKSLHISSPATRNPLYQVPRHHKRTRAL